MQASGEEHQQQQQQHGRGNGGATGGQTMSRNESGNSSNRAGSPASTASAEAPLQSDGGAAAGGGTAGGGHRLKIRLGGSSLSNRGTSVSSEGTNGPATPRATTPVAAAIRATSPAARTNGHAEEHRFHHQQNGTAVQNDTHVDGVKEEEPSASVIMGKKASLETESKTQLEEAIVVEDEEIKRIKEEQLKKALAELPNVAHQSLVPLYELVRRLVARSYTDLQSIIEV